MDLDVLGTTANKFTYEVHYSLVDIITAAATANSSPSTPGFKAAYLEYDGFKVHMKLGFDKIPFSQSNLMHEHETPNWSHPGLTGGDYFSRRDIGITFSTKLLKDKINLYAGAYSGLGETFFTYGNDASGTFEYVARAEFCYPGKMKYTEIDEENSPVVHFRVAANIRYEDKTQPGSGSVSASYPLAMGTYNTYMVNGKRTVYGGDAIIKYRGISATFETDMLNMKPSSSADALYNGTTSSINKGVVNAGGCIAALNYNWEKVHSVFSVVYENSNANDHLYGNQEWMTFAYAYKISSFNSCAKIEYYAPTKEDGASNPLKYTGQFKVGYQIVF